jgi:hypothetical protein
MTEELTEELPEVTEELTGELTEICSSRLWYICACVKIISY